MQGPPADRDQKDSKLKFCLASQADLETPTASKREPVRYRGESSPRYSASSPKTPIRTMKQRFLLQRQLL